MATNTISLEAFTEIFTYLEKNNHRLVDEGKKPTAIGIEGPAGIGKTETIRGIAKNNGMTFVKLNLAELEELGDLTGFPIKEFKVFPILEPASVEDDGTVTEEVLGEPEWVPSDTLSRINNGPCETYHITNESRMAYATPAWLPREFNPNGTILLLDDYSRANQQFMQATMELVNEGRYISWDLPKYTTVVLEKL